jgi:DNA-binding response OmpR family regulator
MREKFKFSPLSVLENERTVKLCGVKIPLTEVEFALFYALYRRRGEYASRAELNLEVWGREGDGSLLSVYAHYLREKLEKGKERIILSSRTLGYAIDKSYFREGDFEK